MTKKNRDLRKEKAKQESLEHSQGKENFNGSGYKGPGNVTHDKVTHNKTRESKN